MREGVTRGFSKCSAEGGNHLIEREFPSLGFNPDVTADFYQSLECGVASGLHSTQMTPRHLLFSNRACTSTCRSKEEDAWPVSSDPKWQRLSKAADGSVSIGHLNHLSLS